MKRGQLEMAALINGINAHNADVRAATRVGEIEFKDSCGNQFILWVRVRKDGTLIHSLASGAWGGNPRNGGTPQALSNEFNEAQMPHTAEHYKTASDLLEAIARAAKYAKRDAMDLTVAK